MTRVSREIWAYMRIAGAYEGLRPSEKLQRVAADYMRSNPLPSSMEVSR